MALPSIGELWRAARKVDDLFAFQSKIEAALHVIEERLRAIEDRLLQLEGRQTQLITEARGAATTAATTIAGAIISDAVTRITRLEGRTEQLEQRGLPP